MKVPLGFKVLCTSDRNCGMFLKWCGAVLHVMRPIVFSGYGMLCASMFWKSMLFIPRCWASFCACCNIPGAMSDAITELQNGAIAKAVNPGPVAMSNALWCLRCDAHFSTIFKLSL